MRQPLDIYSSHVDAILGPSYGRTVAEVCGVDILIAAFHAGITPFGCAMLVAFRKRLRRL